MSSMRDSLTPATPVAALFVFGATALALVGVRDAVIHAADMAHVVPTSGVDPTENPKAPAAASASVKRKGDGHFWTEASLSGVPVKFLLDTGATTVALTRDDARRIGIDTTSLKRDAEVRTAGGRVFAANILLEEVAIGDVVVHNVDAVVIDEGLEHSLLGQSFLNRLSGWEVSAGRVTFHR